jgi:serine/threonine protein phosphatase PrpC
MDFVEKSQDFVKFGIETDIGGNPKNQDHWFQWQNSEKRLCVFGIADGHGKYGEVVSQLTSKTILETIDEELLETDTIGFLHRCFTVSHEKFREICPPWGDSTSLGGTTLTVVAVVHNKVYVANVGDSPVYLCTKNAVLKRSMIRHEIDFAVDPEMELLHDDEDNDKDDAFCSTLELICDHSADNLREFDRIRKQHPSEEHPGYPELLFLYDNHALNKSKDNPIFTVESADCSKPVKNSNGKYYKNVSKQWGTVVVGALLGYLAFTRSIGDFYWKQYGVTEQPEIQSFDLNQIADMEDDNTVCIVAVSDGVSDNWLREHVGKFVMDPSCLNAVSSQPDVGAQRVALSFIRRNKIYGQRNFGNNTDNATANIAYINLKK